MRLGLSARLCASGARGHSHNPERETLAADRDGASGAARGAAAVRGEAARGFGRNATDPSGGLADPLGDAGAGGGDSGRAHRAAGGGL